VVSGNASRAGARRITAHQGGGLQSSGGDLFSEFPHRTSSGTFATDQGHLSLHCQVARLLSKSFLMLGSDAIEFPSRRNKILCHSKEPD
jgi:hypothetical protein